MSFDWKKAVESEMPRLVEIRHHLHQNPELSFEEFETSKLVQKELEGMDLEVRAGWAKGNGVVAILRGTAPGADASDARAVALRGDMDALPIQETTGLPYASKVPNKMHACGHDGHTTMLLGAVKVLAAQRDKLKGSVVFCFQPAEEGGGGGRYMIEEGALNEPKCSAAFALHGFPNLPVGQVAAKSGVAMANTDSFSIVVRGRGGHGAAPHNSVDPVVLAARVVEGLQTVVSREVNPVDAAVITVGSIHGGFATNVIPNEVELKGTIRTLDLEVRKHVFAAIKRMAEGTCAAGAGSAEVKIKEGYPSVTNDPAATAFALKVGRSAFGDEKVQELPVPSMGGEDFGYFLRKVPGSFIRVGTATRENYPRLHNSGYDFSDGALPVGIELFCRIAEQYLEKGFEA